jgi:hypothetical protein
MSDPHVTRLSPPPVFNCVVHVSPPDATGAVVARVANLAGLEARGRTEREALAQVVTAFKARLAAHVAGGETIPWLDPPTPLEPRETQRLIAVHL